MARCSPPSEWPDEVASCISGIEVETLTDPDTGGRYGTTTKVRFWPKDKALNMLGQYLKLFTKVHEHDIKGTLEELVAGSRRKS
jgi:hypothetical protein